MIEDNYKTGGGGRYPGSFKKKPQGRRFFPRTNLATMNKVFVEKTEYISVKIATDANQQCKGRLIDISENGCLVAVPVNLNEGETVLISFVINRRPINSRAAVKRITTRGEVNLVGIQFARLDNVSREFLRAISDVAMLDTDEIGRMKKLLSTGRQNC